MSYLGLTAKPSNTLYAQMSDEDVSAAANSPVPTYVIASSDRNLAQYQTTQLESSQIPAAQAAHPRDHLTSPIEPKMIAGR